MQASYSIMNTWSQVWSSFIGIAKVILTSQKFGITVVN